MTAVALPRPARMLRLEIRHNPVPWVLPLLAALFYYDTFRRASGVPATPWAVGAEVVPDHMLFDFAPFAAGLAAWVASREGRRRAGDLLAATAAPAWARQAAALGATLFWLLLAFLAGVAAVYVQAARQASWGGPPLWPVAVSVAGVVTACVIGFTLGALFPGRFTAPLAAVGVLLLAIVGERAAQYTTTTSPAGLLSPAIGEGSIDPGGVVFYPGSPDIPIAQVMFMGGMTVAMLGILVLAPVLRAWPGEGRACVARTGRWLCAAAAVITAAGLAASLTAYSLAANAQQAVVGGFTETVIPVLHDAASDQPVPYTPKCAGTSFRVCVHPAFGAYLSDLQAALHPVAAEVAGLPGAPAGAREVAPIQRAGIAGTPPVFEYNPFPGAMFNASATSAASLAAWREGFQQGLLDAFIAGPSPYAATTGFGGWLPPNPAQQAVVVALVTAVGSPSPLSAQMGAIPGPSAARVAAAASRLAALSPAARHAWLAAHLPALRAGHVTLAQLP
jgi:hypothetical protein